MMKHHPTGGRPYRWPMALLAYLGLLLAILAALVVGYQLGQRQASDGGGSKPEEQRAARLELHEAQNELTGATAELDILRARYDVDRAALEIVRKEIATQKETILDLEERLQFYRSLMSPADTAQGLSLRPIELVTSERPHRYAYRIVVQQEARKHDLLKGALHVEVFGVQGEDRVTYQLAELSDEVEDRELLLRFRYFQAVEGEIQLPDGFDPEGVTVVARATTPRKAEVREQFQWQILEKFTHVGK